MVAGHLSWGKKVNVSSADKNDIDTMNMIFRNKTFRSSSLSNEKLNDAMEKQRIGVEEFDCSRFVTCFSHINHESVPFWTNYGKDIRTDKVLLQFRNFAKDFNKYIRTDFVKVKDNKQCFFKSQNYRRTINSQSNVNLANYDIRVSIDSINVFDVEYVEHDSAVFTKDNSGRTHIDFSKISGQKSAVIEMQCYDPTVLGKQKSIPWDYERETRILSTLSIPTFNEWDYIDLLLHDEIFRDLQIILSPWDDGELRGKVQEIIQSSNLSEDISTSISVKDSFLKGTLNF